MDKKSGLQRLTLKDLKPHIFNSMIIGVLIRSQNIKCFIDRKTRIEKAVWNFSLRDSIIDYINCTCWGKAGYISNLKQKFCVGDVVCVVRSKITIRHFDDMSERYRPCVTSPFTLTLTEEQSTIITFEGNNYHEYLSLLHYPTKPASAYISLADIYVNGGKIRGDNVNLLVAVQFVKEMKKIKARADGREIQKRELIIFDCTHIGTRVTLWEDEFIQRAENWHSRETILYLADVKVDWSNFERSMVPVINSKTIITEDPLIPQAEFLRKYARTAPIHLNAVIDHMAASISDRMSSQSITKITSAKHIMEMATRNDITGPTTSASITLNSNQKFAVLMYGYITHLDLDGYTKLVVIRCDRCNQPVAPNTKMCLNLECPVGTGAEPGFPKPQFDIRISVSDHTGTVENCRLTGDRAEKILGVTVQEFLKMTDQEKCKLKWKYLFERCGIRFLVLKRPNQSPVITVLSYEFISTVEFTNNLQMF